MENDQYGQAHDPGGSVKRGKSTDRKRGTKEEVKREPIPEARVAPRMFSPARLRRSLIDVYLRNIALGEE